MFRTEMITLFADVADATNQKQILTMGLLTKCEYIFEWLLWSLCNKQYYGSWITNVYYCLQWQREHGFDVWNAPTEF